MNEPSIEAEANAFAMELLLPEKFVRAELVKVGGVDLFDREAVAKLARKFGVDPAVLAFRLGQLSLQ
jgi:Zn-dependent peptidase ImmA (M78 family)